MTKMSKGNALFLSLVTGLSLVAPCDGLTFEKYGQTTDNNIINTEISAENFNGRWGSREWVPLAPDVQVASGLDDDIVQSTSNIKKGVENKPEKVSFLVPLENSSGGSQVNTGDECGPSPLSPTQIEALVRATARKYEVDEDLSVGIAWAESRFDQLRNSPAGARGPMQLMPETAARFGVREICEPEQNIEGGIKYLRLLLNEFKNPLLAIAAYNSGEGRIYEYGVIPPFPETVGYVAEVTNHELGITLPARKPTQIAKQASGAIEPARESGVIPVQKNGKFVAGTMHF